MTSEKAENDNAMEEASTEQPARQNRAGDSLVSRALLLFRAHPERRWTVEQLAAELGTSRAVLGRRFISSLGRSPLRVLRDVRMDHAARLLRETDQGLAWIGDAVGYDSEFAFSRAFFHRQGMRPGRYRSLHRSEPTMMAA